MGKESNFKIEIDKIDLRFLLSLEDYFFQLPHKHKNPTWTIKEELFLWNLRWLTSNYSIKWIKSNPISNINLNLYWWKDWGQNLICPQHNSQALRIIFNNVQECLSVRLWNFMKWNILNLFQFWKYIQLLKQTLWLDLGISYSLLPTP